MLETVHHSQPDVFGRVRQQNGQYACAFLQFERGVYRGDDNARLQCDNLSCKSSFFFRAAFGQPRFKMKVSFREIADIAEAAYDPVEDCAIPAKKRDDRKLLRALCLR